MKRFTLAVLSLALVAGWAADGQAQDLRILLYRDLWHAVPTHDPWIGFFGPPHGPHFGHPPRGPYPAPPLEGEPIDQPMLLPPGEPLEPGEILPPSSRRRTPYWIR